ncbi:hypothetical protein BT69DRAFT_1318338 [Atractiella rhizophila]|nr:hypothetical protein BT69DRAFT_1326993 [Atractiella rhizophila]KAH8925302.1 hypothetical protein BT69DRAFT_1318338 [Atractiella rhizophila]
MSEFNNPAFQNTYDARVKPSSASALITPSSTFQNFYNDVTLRIKEETVFQQLGFLARYDHSDRYATGIWTFLRTFFFTMMRRVVLDSGLRWPDERKGIILDSDLKLEDKPICRYLIKVVSECSNFEVKSACEVLVADLAKLNLVKASSRVAGNMT